VTDVFGLLASGTCQVLAKGQENTHTKHCSRRNEGRERRNKTTIDGNDSAAAAAHCRFHPAQ